MHKIQDMFMLWKTPFIQKYVTIEWTQGFGGNQYHVIYRVNAAMRHSKKYQTVRQLYDIAHSTTVTPYHNNNQTVVRKLVRYHNYPVLVEHRVSYWTSVWNCIYCLQWFVSSHILWWFLLLDKSSNNIYLTCM